MKPALRTVWIVVYSLVGAIAALLLLYLITALAAFLWAAAALAAAMLIFELAFWRCPACGGCWSGMPCRTPPPIRPRRCMRKPCRTKSGPETPFLWWYPLPGAPASWCGFPCQNCRRG